MREKNSHFVNEIHKYCDENVGGKALSSVFTNLYNENGEGIHLDKKDLVKLTEDITRDLVAKGVLIEINKPEEFECPYGYYEIMPHENLAKINGYMKSKMKMLGEKGI
jgi:hypothetical protein